jgi:hypothetical protein
MIQTYTYNRIGNGRLLQFLSLQTKNITRGDTINEYTNNRIGNGRLLVDLSLQKSCRREITKQKYENDYKTQYATHIHMQI